MDLSKVTSTLDNTAHIDSTIKTEGHINSQLNTGDKISSEIQNFRTVEIRYLGGETDNIIVTIDNEKRTINASLKDIQFDSAEMFPEIGSNKLIYIDKSTDGIYVWKDGKYVMVGKDYSVQISEIDKQIAEIAENVDQVQKAQASDSIAIVGLQSDMLTAKADIAGLKTKVEDNTELLDQVNKGHTADAIAIVGLQSDVLTIKETIKNLTTFSVKIVNQLPTTDIFTTTIYLIAKKDSQSNDYYDEYLYINNKWELIGTTKVDLTEIDAKVGELEADVLDLQDQIDAISTDDLMDLKTNQEVGGVKIFKDQVGFKNEDGTIDYIKHINNNLLISTNTGENLLNIDEGLKRAYFFNKEVAFKSDIAESGGTTVKVGGVAVTEFNADSKADASTVEQLGTEVGSLDAMVESLGSDVSQQGTKVNALDSQLVSLATQVAMDYYNKTDSDGKFATKDQMASQDNTTLQSANSYTDTKIADLVDTAPETLDTLGEVAKAIKDNQDVVNALNSAIGNKVDKTVKINGHPLTQNIVLTAEDVGALSDIPDGYVTTDTLNSAMEKKVDKVDGKGLSTNDFTNADKSKLDMLMNYDDTSLDTRVSNLENSKANAIDLADVIDNKTAIGSDSRGTKLGYSSIATDVTSVSIGNKAITSKENDVAIGYGTTVAGSYSVGIGRDVVINTAARESVALGVSAKVGEGDFVENAVQIGRGTNTQSNTLQIFSDNIYNHETHTLSVQEGHFTKIYLE